MSRKPSTSPLDKAAVRRRLRAVRDALPAAERRACSAAIGRHLQALAVVRDARCIFVYLSIPPEVDTFGLVRRWLRDGRRLAVPRLDAPGVMRAVLLEDLDSLRPGTWGMPTPPASARPVEEVDVALCPGLAFDRSGQRLGYGAGYYDRWLAAHPAARRIGLAFGCQLVPELPREPHDVRMQLVVTERGAMATDADHRA